MNVSPLDKNIQAYFNKVDNQFTERKIHKETHDNMFSIENKSHEVIYQFPPERLQDGVAAMWKRMGLYDQKGKVNEENKGNMIDIKI